MGEGGIKSSKHKILLKKFVILLILPLLLTNLPYLSALKQNNPTFPTTGLTERVHEDLDRGLIAIYNSDGDIYLSWRLLQNDSDNIEFDVYRSNTTHPSTKLTITPINMTTDYIDSTSGITFDSKYWVVSQVGGLNVSTSKKVGIMNNPMEPYISFQLEANFDVSDIGIGDLDGDGSYDFIVETKDKDAGGGDPANSAWVPSINTSKVKAYTSNGTLMWTYDRGWDIELGTWFSPFIVYDLDSDGKAEVILKSGEGDHRDLEGRVASGPEYVSIVNGMTGQTITRAPWIPRWNENYSNLARNQMGIAYLDGINPYLIIARGTYSSMKVMAYAYNNEELTEVWHWDSSYEYGNAYYSQGAHTMTCYDVDNDGKDEIILGSCTLDEDGNGLWSTGFTHCDLAYLGDLDPTRPGLEIFYGIEGSGPVDGEVGFGLSMVDAATGKLLWTINEPTEHIHAGFASDISAEYDGAECYGIERADTDEYLLSPQGKIILKNDKDFDFSVFNGAKTIYWDANVQKELLYRGRIWNHDSQQEYISNINGSYWIQDIFGDWREEVIVSVDGEVRIYISTIPASDRRVCLMQDNLYRNKISHQSMGYRPVPLTSYNLAFPNADLIGSEKWSSNEYPISNSIKQSVFYLKYYYVIVGYLVSMLFTGVILFQGKNIGKMIEKFKKLIAKN